MLALAHFLRRALLLPVVLSLSVCSGNKPIAATIVDFAASRGELKITDWNIVGPFAASKSPAESGSVDAGEKALDDDFLIGFGGGETLIDAPDFLKIKDWFSGVENARVSFNDGVVRFDRLFKNSKNAVAYAACALESLEDQEVLMALGADDAMKVWVNGELLLRTNVKKSLGGRPTYGDLGQAGRFRSVTLKKGRNFLLVKVSQLDRMWGFNCTVLTLEAARNEAKARAPYIYDVIERSILPPGASLTLATELREMLRNLKLSAQVDILNSKKEPLWSETVRSDTDWAKSLERFKPSLLYCRVACPLFTLEQPFYYGDADARHSDFQRRYASMAAVDEKAKINFQTLETRWAYLSEGENKRPQDAAWQKKIAHLINEFDDLLTHAASRRPGAMGYPGTHLRGFRSKIDDQLQHYMVHIPEKRARRDAGIPLVVLVPFPLPNTPFLKSIHVANIPLIHSYVKIAERYDYALLWVFARGNPDGAPIAMADIFETIEAVRSDYDIDSDRIYLLGWSYGGTYALLLGERHPGIFAAICAVMPPSDLIAFEENAKYIHSRYPTSWLKLNSPIELVDGLRNTPVYVVHGDEDVTVSVRQSIDFVEKCRRLGIDAKLDVIRGMDHVYAPVDPTLMVFEFFKDKALEQRPGEVSLATAQLKYGSAYWLRISRFAGLGTVGKIDARRRSETTIDVETENIAGYEVLLDRIGHPKDRTLTIMTNGRPSFSGIPLDNIIRVDVEGAAPTVPGPGHKNREIEGPIMHAFASPFLVVEGTARSSDGQASLEFLSRRLYESWMKNYFVGCPRKEDRAVTKDDIQERHLILLGNPETNSLLERIISEMPIRIAPNYIKLGSRRYDGTNLGVELIYPNPLNSKKYVVILGCNSIEACKPLGNNLSQNAWYDFAVWSVDGAQNARVVARGHWDLTWQNVEEAHETPRVENRYGHGRATKEGR